MVHGVFDIKIEDSPCYIIPALKFILFKGKA